MKKKLSAQFDTAWKIILEKYFQALLEFLFPHIAREIDWTKPVIHLDKELLRIQKKIKVGNKIADKLIQVCKNTGEKMWVIIHIELQGSYEKNFSRRLFEYFYRTYDRYKRPITTLAILTDKRDSWRPYEYSQEIWGSRLTFTFPMIKLIDYTSKAEILTKSKNPIAKVIQAHLAALESGKNMTLRFENKLKLVKNLYSLGYTGEDILALYHFIDYAISLPTDLESSFIDEVQEYEEKMNTPYISSAERRGIKKGIEQGIEQGIERGIEQGIKQGIEHGIQKALFLALKKRFSPALSENITKRVQKATIEELEQWLEQILEGTFDIAELQS